MRRNLSVLAMLLCICTLLSTFSMFSARIQAAAAAKITVQPQSVTVIDGTKGVTFSVTASNSKSYQWQKTLDGGKTWNDVPDTSGKTASLKFTGKYAYNGRIYRCVVTGIDGKKVYSSSAKLTVKPVTITVQPVSASFKSGDKATFRVKAANSVSYTYQWQKSTDSGKTWEDVPDASGKTDSLVFNAKYVYNGRMYRCVVKGVSSTKTSDAVKLTVSAVSLKLMSFNVLNNNADGNKYADAAKRAPQTVKMITVDQEPDILGVQEAGTGGNYNWSTELPKALSGTYNYKTVWDAVKEKSGTTIAGARAYHGLIIFFKKNRFTMKDYGGAAYKDYCSYMDNNGTAKFVRCAYQWVKLYDMNAKRDIFVFNTHLMLTTKISAAKNNTIREAQMKELGEAAKTIAGSSPVYIVGDFNSSYDDYGSAYADHTTAAAFTKSFGYKDALKTAESKILNSIKTGTRLDHVFYTSGKAVAKKLLIIRSDSYAPTLSDHKPLLVTFYY